MTKRVLELRNVSKTFPGVKALDSVDFSCRAGEVHALVGENGAGKSTMMKILSGVHQPTEGRVFLRGEPAEFEGAYDAQERGISIIFQEFSLIPGFTVAENVYLNREPGSIGFLDRRRARLQTRALMSRCGIDLDVNRRVEELSVVEQQMVEILKALSIDAGVLIMDEPSATLTDREVKKLFNIIARLREDGKTVLYISHRLEEIFAVADRVTVMKDGRVMGTAEVDKITQDELITLMVGRSLEALYPSLGHGDDQVLLDVRSLSRRGLLHDISFCLFRGEILGIAGMVGSGRTLLAKTLIGAFDRDGGEIRLNGRRIPLTGIRNAIQSGFGYISEDRKAEGILKGMTVQENITVAALDGLTNCGLINSKRERALADGYVNDLQIRCVSQKQRIDDLSGGNQQKVLISRWLANDPTVLIFDEPTRGIDVGAKQEIYRMMRELANAGKGVIMISSELPEVLGMSDRILVMRDGSIVETLNQHVRRRTEEEVISHAVGHSYSLS